MKTSIFLILITFYSMAYAYREEPIAVKPVFYKGLKFEALNSYLESPKMKHNGGYVRVVNAHNNKAICTKEIYEVKYSAGVEPCAQENFITSLDLEGNDLVIGSERLPTIRKSIENFCD